MFYRFILFLLISNSFTCIGQNQIDDTCRFDIAQYFDMLPFSNETLQILKASKVKEVRCETNRDLKFVHVLNEKGQVISSKIYSEKLKKANYRKGKFPPTEQLLAKTDYRYNEFGILIFRHYKSLKQNHWEYYDSLCYDANNRLVSYYSFFVENRNLDSLVYNYRVKKSTKDFSILVDNINEDSLFLDKENFIFKYNTDICTILKLNDSTFLEREQYLIKKPDNQLELITRNETKVVNGLTQEVINYGESYYVYSVQNRRYYTYNNQNQLLRIEPKEHNIGDAQFFTYYSSGLLKECFHISNASIGREYVFSFEKYTYIHFKQ